MCHAVDRQTLFLDDVITKPLSVYSESCMMIAIIPMDGWNLAKSQKLNKHRQKEAITMLYK